MPSEAYALIMQSEEEFSCLSCNINQMFLSIKNFLLKWVFSSLVTRRKMNNSNLILLWAYPVCELMLAVRREEGCRQMLLHFWELSLHSWLCCFNLLCFVNLINFLFKKTIVKTKDLETVDLIYCLSTTWKCIW